MLATLAIILFGWAAAEPVLQGPHAVRLSRRSMPNTLQKREFAEEADNWRVDGQYYLYLKIGTPEQDIVTRFDCEETAIRVYGRPNNEGNDSRSIRNPGFLHTKSSTFQDSDEATPGRARLVMDTFTLGNDTREHQPFIYTDAISGNDATFGFGFPRNGTGMSFWHNASTEWADKRVGVFLSRHRDDPKVVDPKPKLAFTDSEVMIGGVNEDKFTGELASHPFTPDVSGRWGIPLEGITVNGKTIKISPSNSSTNSQPRAHIATTWSFVTGPAAAVGEIYATIPGAKRREDTSNGTSAIYVFPCENTLGIDVRFMIGGREYAMNPRDMVIGTVDDTISGGGWYSNPTPNNGSCVGAFYGGDQDEWRVGTSFLKNVYTVFDFATPAVAFAQLAPDAQPSAVGRDLVSHAAPALRVSVVVSVAAVAAGVICSL